MATWDEWSASYERAFLAVPNDPHQPCPNCGHDELHLVFTGKPDGYVGYASFWCDNCLNGIVISRAPIPEGAVLHSIEQAPEDRRPQVPNFQLVVE